MELARLLPPDVFAGKVAFVTGGGSGINLGIAKAFSALGADVGICGRDAARLAGAAAELSALGARTFTAVADVRDPAAVNAALTGCRAALGPVHTLVCGAAGNFPCEAEKLSPNGFKAVVDIDLLGSFNASRAAFDQLRESAGNIIFISAGQAWLPYFAQAHVGAAKAGVDHLMRNLALEWGRFGIRANSVAPGPIDGTEGMRRLAPADSGVGDELRRAIPLQRFGTADDVAAAAVFLASPLASYVTGTVLVVDGGMNLPGSGVFSQILTRDLHAP